MYISANSRHSISVMTRKSRTIAHVSLLPLLSLIFLLLLLALGTEPARGQTFTALYSLTSPADGWSPNNVTMDRAGNLYGTTAEGGYSDGYCQRHFGCGTVFKLSRHGSGWNFRTIHDFAGDMEGAYPGPVVVAPNGVLYGTTQYGGSECAPDGCGTIFGVRPSPHAGSAVLSPWIDNVLYSFSGGVDGWGSLTMAAFAFDNDGNMYATSESGGAYGYGFIYKLTLSGGSWTRSVLYSFNGTDGAEPYSGVIMDAGGNLYGTTFTGGSNGWGTVFELSPAGNGWTEKVLHNFASGNDGWWSTAGLAMDTAGNLYGATLNGGTGGGGVVFELSPSDGQWNYSIIYNLSSTGLYGGPRAALAIDAAGSLYGSTTTPGCMAMGCRQISNADGGRGTVFKLSPGPDGWIYTLLHDFTGGSDGIDPYYGVIVDDEGIVYGAARPGTGNAGVIFSITP
jgi:uncharacterized repeat protein (TIGR03803 family)